MFYTENRITKNGYIYRDLVHDDGVDKPAWFLGEDISNSALDMPLSAKELDFISRKAMMIPVCINILFPMFFGALCNRTKPIVYQSE